MNIWIKVVLLILALSVIWFLFATKLVQIGFPAQYSYGNWIDGIKRPTEICLGKSEINTHRGPESGFKICYGVALLWPF